MFDVAVTSVGAGPIDMGFDAMCRAAQRSHGGSDRKARIATSAQSKRANANENVDPTRRSCVGAELVKVRSPLSYSDFHPFLACRRARKAPLLLDFGDKSEQQPLRVLLGGQKPRIWGRGKRANHRACSLSFHPLGVIPMS
ncbi:hypothetical protein HPB52_016829 [Rhipicephalus sanguineus]|uniref:Uncharacterized protein n=1 Tax=Rhipicephalus sanguineus TaxID=34632 RepID=A0A9D4Q6R1_RHISA|nr:hypothetical protein HPB52_016829 [Rhipicephalus sanguineus]